MNFKEFINQELIQSELFKITPLSLFWALIILLITMFLMTFTSKLLSYLNQKGKIDKNLKRVISRISHYDYIFICTSLLLYNFVKNFGDLIFINNDIILIKPIHIILSIIIIGFAIFLEWLSREILKNSSLKTKISKQLLQKTEFLIIGILRTTALYFLLDITFIDIHSISLVDTKFFHITPFHLYWGFLDIFISIYFIFISKQIFEKYILKKSIDKDLAIRAYQIIKMLFLFIAIGLILNGIIVDFKKAMDYEFIKVKNISITTTTLLFIITIWLVTRLVLMGIKKIFTRQIEAKKIDFGISNSVFQIIKYALWVIAISLILETIGVNITILLAGSAALLVGLGLGIQQIFNDIVSGLILLFERNLKVGDIVEIEELVGKVNSIGIRTSLIVTLDNIQVVVPNSKFIGDKVINWSHIEDNTRFKVEVGVAYGSDVRLVEKLLLECAKEHPYISQSKGNMVLFENFGDSSLDFALYFWTEKTHLFKKIQSDLRFTINKKFKENNIEIPFPQQDVYIKQIVKTE